MVRALTCGAMAAGGGAGKLHHVSKKAALVLLPTEILICEYHSNVGGKEILISSVLGNGLRRNVSLFGSAPSVLNSSLAPAKT